MNNEITFDGLFALCNSGFLDRHRRVLLDACDKYREVFVE